MSALCLPCSDDEDVTCAVCDRSFPTPVHLEAHMVKHRHWLCSTCDTLFNSVVQLEYHKVRTFTQAFQYFGIKLITF